MYQKCYAKIENNSQKTSRSYRFISGLYIVIIKALDLQGGIVTTKPPKAESSRRKLPF